MKRILIVILMLFFVITLPTACNIYVDDSIKEISEANITNKELRATIESCQHKNGAYLIEDNGKVRTTYLILNSRNIKQGDKATEFGNFRVVDRDNEMHIYYEEKETEALSNIKNMIIYKMVSKHTPDTIRIYKNDKEISFEAISVIGN